MSKTSLQIVNSVLTRIREDTVSDFTDEYSALVLEFLNDTLQEMQDRHQWRVRIGETLLTTVAAQLSYDLSDDTDGAGAVTPGSAIWTPSSSLVMTETEQGSKPNAWDYTDGQTIYQMNLLEDETLGQWQFNRSTARGSIDSGGVPLSVYLRRPINTDTVTLEYLQDPGVGRTLSLMAYIPQDDLTTHTDVIYLPHRPLILGTFAKVLEERGEELGSEPGAQNDRYAYALDQAILRDIDERDEWSTPV